VYADIDDNDEAGILFDSVEFVFDGWFVLADGDDEIEFAFLTRTSIFSVSSEDIISSLFIVTFW
jgi:hypothetical protein